MESTAKTALHPQPQRLADEWQRLSEFREVDLPGWSRPVFSGAYRQARSWLQSRMEVAGLTTRLDAGSNLIGRLEGGRPDLPTIILGSHTDTVIGGGRFDGVIGVLAAIELARCLRDSSIQLRHALEVIDFLSEEPNEFGMSMLGSRVLAGAISEEALHRKNSQGQTLGDAIASVGGRPHAIPDEARRPESVGLYLEFHVEQGSTLERAGMQVGVVTSISGITRFRVDLHGKADHAGTTPMDIRRDALKAAAEIILAVEGMWRDCSGVGTVGRLALEPNAPNVVPGHVELITDMRSVHRATLLQKTGEFREKVGEISSRRPVETEIDLLSHEDPVPIAEWVHYGLEEAARCLGIPVRRMLSHAGHDANQMAKIAPIGLLFVPSREGRSHCPEEWTDMADVHAGVRTLGAALLRFDEML